MVVDIVSPHDMTWTSQHSPWRLWISTNENKDNSGFWSQSKSVNTFIWRPQGKLNAIGLFCFCLCQNGGQSQLSYHPCFQLIQLTTGLSALQWSYPSTEPHIPVKNMPYLSLQLPVLKNYTQNRMGHNRPLSLSLSVLLFLSTVRHIGSHTRFLTWPFLDKHYCLVKLAAVLLPYFIKHN